MKNRILELFSTPSYTSSGSHDWEAIISQQKCSYTGHRCIKTRKSEPTIAIGTCVVAYGSEDEPIVICPNRFLARGQVFTDCLHLLNLHEPGNELHIVPEITIPGGSIDYFLVSARRRKVVDFAGIELQTIDTTGTVWPERQRLVKKLGLQVEESITKSEKSYGMNWKMTAKTILIQLHHKIGTFQHLNKHLVLIVQDSLIKYMKREFSFAHIQQARLGDSMHIHSYAMRCEKNGLEMELVDRLSTDQDGIAVAMGLKANPNIELSQIVRSLEAHLTDETLLGF